VVGEPGIVGVERGDDRCLDLGERVGADAARAHVLGKPLDGDRQQVAPSLGHPRRVVARPVVDEEHGVR
jgi:hypothetical protein